LTGYSFRLSERFSQQEFDLAVQAAQIVVCPPLHSVEHVAIDPKQKRFPFRHASAQ